MKYHKDIFEIVFFGRGGQGAKVAAEIIVQAANQEGKFVQAFPSFGPERSGAPTRTYVRIADKPIRTREPIVDPNLVIVLDETLLETEPVTKNLSQDEVLIVNSSKSPEELKNKLGFSGKIYPVDADGISFKVIGQMRPNTVILGKLVQITEIANLESINFEFEKIFLEKIGKEATQKNLQAIEAAYDTI